LERDGWAWKEGGLSLQDLQEIREDRGLQPYSIKSVSELLAQSHDIFAPCAGSGTLNKDVARALAARWVIEGANLPTTPEAHKILTAKGVAVVPDLLANAGGVFASWIEWSQNMREAPIDKASVAQHVWDRLYSETLRLWEKTRLERVRLIALAAEKVIAAEALRGRLPRIR